MSDAQVMADIADGLHLPRAYALGVMAALSVSPHDAFAHMRRWRAAARYVPNAYEYAHQPYAVQVERFALFCRYAADRPLSYDEAEDYMLMGEEMAADL